MKSLADILQDFGANSGAVSPSELSKPADDEELLDTFEQGYKAGWEDAIRAKSDEMAHVSTILGQNLQEMSFTYHDARATVLADLAPLFSTLVEKILPEFARQTIGLQIVEQLNKLADTTSVHEAQVHVAPTEVEAVRAVLPKMDALQIHVAPDPMLDEGQAHISINGRERQIDFEELFSGLNKTFEAFIYQTQKQREQE